MPVGTVTNLVPPRVPLCDHEFACILKMRFQGTPNIILLRLTKMYTPEGLWPFTEPFRIRCWQTAHHRSPSTWSLGALDQPEHTWHRQMAWKVSMFHVPRGVRRFGDSETFPKTFPPSVIKGVCAGLNNLRRIMCFVLWRGAPLIGVAQLVAEGNLLLGSATHTNKSAGGGGFFSDYLSGTQLSCENIHSKKIQFVCLSVDPPSYAYLPNVVPEYTQRVMWNVGQTTKTIWLCLGVPQAQRPPIPQPPAPASQRHTQKQVSSGITMVELRCIRGINTIAKHVVHDSKHRFHIISSATGHEKIEIKYLSLEMQCRRTPRSRGPLDGHSQTKVRWTVD